MLSAFVLLTLELIDLQRINEDLVLLCGDRVVLVFSFRDVRVVSWSVSASVSPRCSRYPGFEEGGGGDRCCIELRCSTTYPRSNLLIKTFNFLVLGSWFGITTNVRSRVALFRC